MNVGDTQRKLGLSLEQIVEEYLTPPPQPNSPPDFQGSSRGVRRLPDLTFRKLNDGADGLIRKQPARSGYRIPMANRRGGLPRRWFNRLQLQEDQHTFAPVVDSLMNQQQFQLAGRAESYPSRRLTAAEKTQQCQDSAITEAKHFFNANGDLVVRLKDTDVVTIKKGTGEMILDSGGWRTMSTRHVINECLAPLGFSLSVHGGNVWQVVNSTSSLQTFTDKMSLKKGPPAILAARLSVVSQHLQQAKKSAEFRMSNTNQQALHRHMQPQHHQPLPQPFQYASGQQTFTPSYGVHFRVNSSFRPHGDGAYQDAAATSLMSPSTHPGRPTLPYDTGAAAWGGQHATTFVPQYHPRRASEVFFPHQAQESQQLDFSVVGPTSPVSIASNGTAGGYTGVPSGGQQLQDTTTTHIAPPLQKQAPSPPGGTPQYQ